MLGLHVETVQGRVLLRTAPDPTTNGELQGLNSTNLRSFRQPYRFINLVLSRCSRPLSALPCMPHWIEERSVSAIPELHLLVDPLLVSFAGMGRSRVFPVLERVGCGFGADLLAERNIR